MSWTDRIIAAHRKVTDAVSHAQRMKSERYFVWQEDPPDWLAADDRRGEALHRGSTDLFTKREFDPWRGAFEAALDEDESIAWELNSIQYEEETGFFHYEWIWEVIG